MIFRIDFELFPGEILWGKAEEYYSWEPNDEKDYGSTGYVEEKHLEYVYREEIDQSALRAPQGVYMRSSREHGFLWFQKPVWMEHFGFEKNVPYMVRSVESDWEVHLVPFLGNLIQSPRGMSVFPVTPEKIRSVLDSTVLVGTTRADKELAIDLAKNRLLSF